jgi:hypothetical protein
LDTPYGVPAAAGVPRNDGLFEEYPLKDVIPAMEGKYRVAEGHRYRSNRGALHKRPTIASDRVGTFGSVQFGVFVSGAIPGDFETRFASLLKEPKATNGKINVLADRLPTGFVISGIAESLQLLTKDDILSIPSAPSKESTTTPYGASFWPPTRPCCSVKIASKRHS